METLGKIVKKKKIKNWIFCAKINFVFQRRNLVQHKIVIYSFIHGS